MNKFFISLILLLNMSQFTSAQWQWQNPLPQGNSLYSVQFLDDNNGYAVGGVYDISTIIKTTDGGNDWVLINSGVETDLHSVHFINNNTGWAVGNPGTIIKTTDGGENWFTQTSGVSAWLSEIYFINENIGWTVGSDGTALKTMNGGNNWVILDTDTSAFLSDIFFIDQYIGWIVGKNGLILNTTNGGIDWTIQPSSTSSWLLSIHLVSQNVGWAVGGNSEYTEGIILKTSNGGLNWIEQNSGQSNRLVSVHFLDENNGITVGTKNVFPHYDLILRTSDGGNTWLESQTNLNTHLEDVTYTDPNNIWSVGTYGMIVKSTDGGENWISQIGGFYLRRALQAVYFVNPTIGWVVTPSVEEDIYKTTNGGQDWFLQDHSQVGGGALNSIYFIDVNTGWITGANILKTTDGGSTWIKQEPQPGYFHLLNSIHFIDENMGWVVGEEGFIAATIDGGSLWNIQNSGTSASLNSVYFHNENIGYVVGNNGIYLRTTDGGTNWLIDNLGPGKNLVSISFVNSNIGWIAGNYSDYLGIIYNTTDGGLSWDIQISDTILALYSIDFINSSTGWAVGTAGTILTTINAGASWTEQYSGVWRNIYSVEMIDENDGWTVGEGGMILKYGGEPNNPPIIILPTTIDTAYPGIYYSYHPTLVDPDQDSTILILGEGPAWLSVIDDLYLAGFPGNSNTGSFEVQLRADDLNGGIADTSYTLIVINNLPPIPITNLRLGSAPEDTSVWLKWTAPGGHWNEGQASNYDLRYSQTTLNELNFDSATPFTPVPPPSTYGSTDSVLVTGLSSGTKYYFAIKSTNSEGQISAISNVLVVITSGGVNNYPPEVTTHGNTQAYINLPYYYNEQNLAMAVGTEPITWAKVLGPEDFTILLDGNINWTPDSLDAVSGSLIFVIRASNTFGTDDDSVIVVFSAASVSETFTSDTSNQFLDFLEAGAILPTFINHSFLSGIIEASQIFARPGGAGGQNQYNFANEYWSFDSSIPDNMFNTSMVLYYDESRLDSIREGELVIVVSEAPGEEWIEYPEQQLDTESNTIKLNNVTRLSLFALADDPLTNIDTENNGSIPDKFKLFHNYPNPFNPTTVIKYSIPVSTIVTIRLYDILGREVKTLVNEYKPSGNYTIQLNAGSLASGVYIYRMLAGKFVDAKKLLLLK